MFTISNFPCAVHILQMVCFDGLNFSRTMRGQVSAVIKFTQFHRRCKPKQGSVSVTAFTSLSFLENDVREFGSATFALILNDAIQSLNKQIHVVK